MYAIVSEPFRIAYAPIPKCGSTTMMAILAALHGVAEGENVRDAVRPVPLAGKGGAHFERGLAYFRVPDAQLPDFLDRYADFTWFSVVRDPYDRVVSSYCNKLNRYLRRFQPLGYYVPALLKLVDPDRAGSRARKQLRMRSWLGFGDFVRGLERHGIGWDDHYRLQSEVIRLDRLPFMSLLRLETLADTLPSFLRRAGVGEDMLGALSTIARRNPSLSKDEVDYDEESRAIVERLYAADFLKLGYPMRDAALPAAAARVASAA